MTKQRVKYDTPWKDILDQYFAEFIMLFFPKVYDDIDWEKKYEFLDKELQKIIQDSEIGQRFVDKLVKIWRKNTGEEEWLLIHLEVQSQHEMNFARRMYVYNYRVFDRYSRMVASMAILGDEHPSWRPDTFRYEIWGCKVSMEFPVVKLLDYRARWDELEKSKNPFAIVVMAHLKTQETYRNPENRKLWKINLTRMLYERGYKQRDIRNLFRFIDWLMRLPEELENEFWQEIRHYEEVKRMPYITNIERKAIKRGFAQGIEEGIEKGIEKGTRQELYEGIELGLELKFGEEGLKLMPEIREITDIVVLKAIRSRIKPAKSLDDLRGIYSK